MKNQNQNHNWSTNDFNNTLDTVLRLSNTDEKEVNAILSAEIGCTTGAVKAARVSFSRIAAGFEPSKKGTRGITTVLKSKQHSMHGSQTKADLQCVS